PSFEKVNVEIRYTETTRIVNVRTKAPTRFSASTRCATRTKPSVPPARTAPPNRSHGGPKEIAAHKLSSSNMVPATLTGSASITSERIHRHANKNPKNGNTNAPSPNT